MSNKSALLKKRTEERDVEVPGYGKFRIRSLTRADVLKIQGEDLDEAKMEQKLLAMAIVGPELWTEDEVRQWQEVSPPGEIQALSDAILEMSGMAKQVAQEAMTRFREGS